MARRLRYYFEAGHPWPLWESGSTTYTMEPADYKLSAELTELLRYSYTLWDEHFGRDQAWDSAENHWLWTRISDQALAVLRREVADIADVLDERRP